MQNEERINGLETQVRTLKRIVYGFGCVLVAGCAVGTSMQTVPDVIQAMRFEVVNDEGKVFADLSMNEDGTGMFCALNILNNNGEIVAALSEDKDGTGGLTLYKEGEPVFVLGADKDGGGTLNIHNIDGQIVALLGVDEDGGGALATFDNKGEITSINPAPKTSK